MNQKTVTIKQQIEQLDRILEWFEAEDFEIEQASVQFKKAQTLAAEINKKLSQVENEVQIIKHNFEES